MSLCPQFRDLEPWEISQVPTPRELGEYRYDRFLSTRYRVRHHVHQLRDDRTRTERVLYGLPGLHMRVYSLFAYLD